MMNIAPNSSALKGRKKRGEVKGKYGRIWGVEEGNANYGGMVQPSQEHVTLCVKGVEWRLGTRGYCSQNFFFDGWRVPIEIFQDLRTIFI